MIAARRAVLYSCASYGGVGLGVTPPTLIDPLAMRVRSPALSVRISRGAAMSSFLACRARPGMCIWDLALACDPFYRSYDVRKCVSEATLHVRGYVSRFMRPPGVLRQCICCPHHQPAEEDGSSQSFNWVAEPADSLQAQQDHRQESLCGAVSLQTIHRCPHCVKIRSATARLVWLRLAGNPACRDCVVAC